MQEYLASYLFQYKKCPLPGLGSLVIHRTEAVIVAGEKKILAPKEAIQFSTEEESAADLELFIAAQTGVNREEASYRLSLFCNGLKNMQEGDRTILPGAGEFYVDAENFIAFLPQQISPAFIPEIFAERVIHPDKTHAILVGDRETTNAVMTEYFAEKAPKHKSKWWIFAILFFLISAALILYYLNDKNRNSSIGVAHKYEAAPAPKTYRAVP